MKLEKLQRIIEDKEPTGINDFYRALKDYCRNLKKFKFVPARRILDINKSELIILEARIDELDNYWKNQPKKDCDINFPNDRVFLEIPSWVEKVSPSTYMSNLGGVLIFKEQEEKFKGFTTMYSLWVVFDTNNNPISIKPISVSFKGGNFSRSTGVSEIMRVGGAWKKYPSDIGPYLIPDELKRNIGNKINDMLRIILDKFNKKEYTKYKKWSPCGIIEKEIVYSYEVSKHKRHFWKDSGRFKIPLMSEHELKERGYGIDELVLRDGEVRKNVPYKIIGDFIVGNQKEIIRNNKRISLFSKRILRQEQKLFNILQELFPSNFIKRHDRKILKGLELDFLIREKRLAFEYDGEQHFDKELCEKVFKSDFTSLQKRDRKKDKMCDKKNMTLIRIKYDEPLTKSHIKKKLKKVGITI